MGPALSTPVSAGAATVASDAFERWDGRGGPRQLARGSTDRQIAADLGITTKTVAHYVQHVYDKIGVRSRAGTTLFAVAGEKESGLSHRR